MRWEVRLRLFITRMIPAVPILAYAALIGRWLAFVNPPGIVAFVVGAFIIGLPSRLIWRKWEKHFPPVLPPRT